MTASEGHSAQLIEDDAEHWQPAEASEPIARFKALFEHAAQTEPDQGTRCVLATADQNAEVSARYILLKAVTEDGRFRFFTNYDSRKAYAPQHQPEECLPGIFLGHPRHPGTCIRFGT